MLDNFFQFRTIDVIAFWTDEQIYKIVDYIVCDLLNDCRVLVSLLNLL